LRTIVEEREKPNEYPEHCTDIYIIEFKHLDEEKEDIKFGLIIEELVSSS
jgi:hypothetical protein